MKIACFIYPGFTVIDLIGPTTVWSIMPDVAFQFIAAKKGPVQTDAGVQVIATHDLTDFDRHPDVVLVPGGATPTFDALKDDALLDAIAEAGANAKWVTSVCTGSILLGAAGLLKGYRAASHWYARPFLNKFGAIADDARAVIDRNRATGGGATAGIDFGLTMLAQWTGEQNAKVTELLIEYAPEPPFRTGRPELADAETLAIGRGFAEAAMPESIADDAARRRGVLSAA
jgi:cyclohexyl-isocyanide hydratase